MDKPTLDIEQKLILNSPTGYAVDFSFYTQKLNMGIVCIFACVISIKYISNFLRRISYLDSRFYYKIPYNNG